MRPTEAVYRSPLVAAGGLAITGSGRQHAMHAVKARKLPSYAVVLVENGQGFLETDACGRLDVKGPALFWLFPNRQHSYGPDADGWNERWALFEGSLLRDFLRLRLISEQDPLVNLRNLDRIQRLFGGIHADLLEDSNLARASAAASLHQIVILAAQQASQATPSLQEGADMAEIVEALRHRATQPLDIAALAAEYGMSPATFRRKIAREVGLPPKGFQLRVRMDHAKELLATTDDKIEIIAAKVGIDDAFYFSRLFHERENCTPREFRSRFRRS
ncbi:MULTISPECIES: AraC family transcriptional regulator [unclassified Rhizobium]|uniref:helix-turn-helix transcriptional regulator n=1 Tax=unclassified Rhizobium TaxID=2613769 RepID=UPI000EAAC37E|nr:MULTISPECIES: AraC family transcriptional regulator [unclassified Rhizobium]AYG69081.1 AraC family transcriptional regulator [Rhizobium sp. CCGE531]AYG75461.1 AraC family transcriptional regulator [Rhizobium sp. CCGE532]